MKFPNREFRQAAPLFLVSLLLHLLILLRVGNPLQPVPRPQPQMALLMETAKPPAPRAESGPPPGPAAKKPGPAKQVKSLKREIPALQRKRPSVREAQKALKGLSEKGASAKAAKGPSPKGPSAKTPAKVSALPPHPVPATPGHHLSPRPGNRSEQPAPQHMMANPANPLSAAPPYSAAGPGNGGSAPGGNGSFGKGWEGGGRNGGTGGGGSDGTGIGTGRGAREAGGGAGTGRGVKEAGGGGNGGRGTARSNYEATLKRLIEAHKQYPVAARKAGREGRCEREFVLLRDGTLKSVKNLSSCGHPFLDAAATRAITSVGKFPPIPADYPGSEVAFTVPISFTLHGEQ